mgnify:CR=1 FL=1
MTKPELSLLLYFETCAVDLGGRVDIRRINDTDLVIAKRWVDAGYLEFGRIRTAYHNSQGTHWVHLSDKATEDAQAERRTRTHRMWNNRAYVRTCEEVVS